MKVTGLKVPKTGVTDDNPNKILHVRLLVLLVLFLVLSAPAANM